MELFSKSQPETRAPVRDDLIRLTLYVLSIGFLGAFISTVILTWALGISLEQIPSLLEDPADPRVKLFLQSAQILNSTAFFIVPVVVFFYRCQWSFVKLNLLYQKPAWLLILLVIGLVITSQPLIELSAWFNKKLVLAMPSAFSGLVSWMQTQEAEALNQIETLLQMDGWVEFVFSLIVVAILPAISEEWLFRGTLQPMILYIYKKPHLAVWLTAFVFSFIHLQFLGFLPRLALGALLGYLSLWTGSLIYPILFHFLNNALGVYQYYAHQHQLWLPADNIAFSKASIIIGALLTLGALSLFVYVAGKKYMMHHFSMWPFINAEKSNESGERFNE